MRRAGRYFLASLALVVDAGLGFAAPANDHCADATVVASLPFTDTLSTTEATRDADDPAVCTSDGGLNVWYRFTPARDGMACVRTVGSSYQTAPHPLAGSCTGPPVGNYHYCGPTQDVLFAVAAGVPIFVQVSSMGSTGGWIGPGGHLVVTIADAALDSDADGVDDCRDGCLATPDPDQRDADFDGAGDACDTCFGDGPDLDGDGWCGSWDGCPTVADPAREDVDHDGFGDACDSCPGYGTIDTDGDGVCDEDDGCDARPGPEPGDADGDALCDAVDNCPTVANPGQEDSDVNSEGDPDGFGDACDVCPGYGTIDTDGDGVCDEVDTCDHAPNPDRSDRDGDGIGDICDACPASQRLETTDRDGDGRPDVCDACPEDPLDTCATFLGCTHTGALVRLGPGSDAASLVGLMPRGCRGLAVQPETGVLFITREQVNEDGLVLGFALARVDPRTAQEVVVGPLTDRGTAYWAVNSLAFRADGTLFGFGGDPGRLVTIDPATGAVTPIGTTDGTTRFGHGLVFDGERLLLADSLRLLALDPATGAGERVTWLGFPLFCSAPYIHGLAIGEGGTLFGLMRCDYDYLVTIDRDRGPITRAGGNLPPWMGGIVLAPPESFDEGCDDDTLAGGKPPPVDDIAPARPEQCDNCVDDDGNGLVDLEDSACCGGQAPVASALRKARVKPAGATSAIRLAAGLGRIDLGSFSPPANDVFVQLRSQAGGPPLCARLPAEALRVARKSRGLAFRDRLAEVASAKGIRALRLDWKKGTHEILLTLHGKAVALPTRAGDALHLTVGVRSATTAWCRSATGRPRAPQRLARD